MDGDDPNRIDASSERRLMTLENIDKQSHNGGTMPSGPTATCGSRSATATS